MSNEVKNRNDEYELVSKVCQRIDDYETEPLLDNIMDAAREVIAMVREYDATK